MAINPESQYPGKIAPSSAQYPYGEARNITVPGDGTGTPWEAALVNDIFGHQQSLLSEAGVVPSGSPEEVGASQYLKASKKLFGSSLESVTESLAGLLVDSENDGTKVSAAGFRPGSGGYAFADPSTTGGGVFVAAINVDKSEHNGIDVISPTVPAPSAQAGVDIEDREAAWRSGTGETDPAGAGCWVRLDVDDKILAAWAGGIDGSECGLVLQDCANVAEARGIKDIVFGVGAFTLSTKTYFACDDVSIRDDLYRVIGAGQTATVLECRVTGDYALFGSRLQLADLKLNGPGKNNGDNVSGIRHHPLATVTKGTFRNVEITNMSGEAWRTASVYGWECASIRIEFNNHGIICDSTGPFGAAAATGLSINDSYIAGNNNIGIEFDGGVFNSLIANTYFEFNDIGISANAGSSITLENVWFESNTTWGLQGVDINVKVLGTLIRQGAGDQFDTNYAGGGSSQPAVESLQQALAQDIVWRDKELGHRSTRSTLTNYHVYDAKGSAAGLRDKYPVASIKPVIDMQLFVESDGTVDALDTYGLSVSKTGTGIYEISWPDSTFTLGTGGNAKIPHVSLTPVSGTENGTASPRFASFQLLGANWGAFRNATGIRVHVYDAAGTLTDCGFSATISLRLGNAVGLATDFNIFGRDTTA